MATLCRHPFVTSGAAYDCGQCLPCRSKRRRLWTHRLMLESLQHGMNTFVTLTYREDCVPRVVNTSEATTGTSTGLPTLRAVDLQLWLKRLRQEILPKRVRFYGVGEYGDVTERPHYHVMLFGFPNCRYGRSRYNKIIINCCDVCNLVRDSWGHGFVGLGEVNVQTCMYVCGYMLKKMTKVDDVRLRGRSPEFCRMSLKPGIGAWAMDEVAHSMLSYDLEKKLVDVPQSLRHGVKLMPLGRYLRRRLRERIGRDVACPEAVLEEMAEEMRPLSRVHERYSALFGQTFTSYCGS